MRHMCCGKMGACAVRGKEEVPSLDQLLCPCWLLGVHKIVWQLSLRNALWL